MSATLTTPLTGGCACGAIRYESTALPVVMLHCHCRDCQQSSGGPYSSFVVVPKDAFRVVKGEPRFHPTPSEAGGHNRRGFCAACGSPILSLPDAVPQIVGIRTTSLDDASGFQQQLDAWTCDAQPWDVMNSALPKFEKYPS
ncbi:MAG: GFA family protein [Chthoniobacter sp.]|uniref:GFA family protein n=1 Tax=Chthoniobacter sp. TaxID=2510640 RepID=UPI0032A57318